MNENGKICGQPETFAFSDEYLDRVDAVVARYPDDRRASALMPLLSLAQEQNAGWLPKAAMDHVADMLDIPHIRAYEVATFYTMYNLEPMGRHHVQVCTNISCWLRGSDEVLDACRKFLGVGVGRTTEDGAFTLTEVECLGACVNAPVVQIGKDYFEDLDGESVVRILEAFKAGETPKPGPQNGRKGCEPSSGLTSLTFDDAGEAVQKDAGGA